MNTMSRIAALLFLVAGAPAQAEQLQIPLQVGMDHVESLAASALNIDDGGRAVLAPDDCNRVTVSDLSLARQEDLLRAEMAIGASAGTAVFGNCIGPGTWRGRIAVDLMPNATPDGYGIRLSPESARLLQADGSPGFISRPARLLAERLVLPRLGSVRVDLHDAMRGLDDLLAAVQPDRETEGSVRLAGVAVGEAGITATLAFSIHPTVTAPGPPEPALDAAEMKRWRTLEDELDGFLTVVVADLARRAGDRDLRLEMLGVLQDSRLAIARSLAGRRRNGGGEPVRRLFVESWDRLRPYVQRLASTRGTDELSGPRLAAFVAGADALRALDALGPEYGFEISRDGLRRLARALLAGDAPASFTPLPLGVDGDLRLLFGLDDGGSDPAPAAGPLAGWLDWIVPPALADTQAEDPAEALRRMLPRLPELDAYLDRAADLLEQSTAARLEGDTRIPSEYRHLVDPLVRATAWKETCWRHYLDHADPPKVIRSPVGAVGMMQINVRVWRGLYDMENLEADVAYNVASGIEILEHYFVDYAIRRGEHIHPGGAENLVRATYAAYNGGPGQMARYRREGTPARLQAIDRAFWEHFDKAREQRFPDVGSCYPV